MCIKLINGNENPGIMKKIILLLLLASIIVCIQCSIDSNSMDPVSNSFERIDTEVILSLVFYDDYYNPKWENINVKVSIHNNRYELFQFREELTSGERFWRIFEDKVRLAEADVIQFTIEEINYTTPRIVLRESDFYVCDGDAEHLRELGVSFTARYFTGRDEFDFRVYIYGNVERELTF